MFHALYFGIILLLIFSAAWLASRAEHWRDARWVGVLAIAAVTVVFAFSVGRFATA